MYGDSGLLFGFRVIVLGIKAAIFGTQPQSQPPDPKAIFNPGPAPRPSPRPQPQKEVSKPRKKVDHQKGALKLWS